MESTMNYAGFWRRFGAYLIDYIIILIIAIMFVFLVWGEEASWIAPIIYTIYFIGFWSRRGQTPGMMVVRVKIIKTDGSPISIGRAILRCIGFFVSTIIIIGHLMIAWDSKKQGLHDKIADTYVIKTK